MAWLADGGDNDAHGGDRLLRAARAVAGRDPADQAAGNSDRQREGPE